MRIVDIDKMDVNEILKNPYEESALIKAFEAGADAVLSALDDLPICLDWIDTRDELPSEEKDQDIFLCVIELEAGHKEFRFMRYWLDSDSKGNKQIFWVSNHTFYTNNEVIYWADITNLLFPD